MAVKPKSQALEMPTCEDRLLWDVLSSRMHIPALVVAEQVGLFSLLAKGPARRSHANWRCDLEKARRFWPFWRRSVS